MSTKKVSLISKKQNNPVVEPPSSISYSYMQHQSHSKKSAKKIRIVEMNKDLKTASFLDRMTHSKSQPKVSISLMKPKKQSSQN